MTGTSTQNSHPKPHRPGKPVCDRGAFGCERTHRIVLAVFATAAILYSWTLIAGIGPRLDEKGHFAQILLFSRGICELFVWPGHEYPANAMLPGYHAILALIGMPFGCESLTAFRILNLLLSLLLVNALWLTARATGQRDPWLRTAQIYFIPILFVYHFLIYTDDLSLLLLVFALLGVHCRRAALGGVAGFASLLVRQSNIVPLACILLYGLLREGNPITDFRASLRYLLAKAWPFPLAGVAFLVFVAVNGRIGIDEPGSQEVAFGTANLLFSLVAHVLLFLPLHIANAPDTRDVIRRHPRQVILMLILVAVAVVVCDTTNPWNQLPYLVRNKLLALLTGSFAGNICFAAAVSAAVLSLCAMPMLSTAGNCVYLLWFLSVIPVPLVEPRYYLTAFAFHALLRKPASPRTEWLLLVWLMLLALLLQVAHGSGQLML